MKNKMSLEVNTSLRNREKMRRKNARTSSRKMKKNSQKWKKFNYHNWI